MKFIRVALVLVVISMGAAASAQQGVAQPQQAPAAAVAPDHETLTEQTPVVTHHQITINGKPLKYTATAGRLAIKPESGPAEAAIRRTLTPSHGCW